MYIFKTIASNKKKSIYGFIRSEELWHKLILYFSLNRDSFQAFKALLRNAKLNWKQIFKAVT